MTGVAIATALAQIITRDTIYSIKLSRTGIQLREEPGGFEMDQGTVAEAMRTRHPPGRQRRHARRARPRLQRNRLQHHRRHRRRGTFPRHSHHHRLHRRARPHRRRAHRARPSPSAALSAPTRTTACGPSSRCSRSMAYVTSPWLHAGTAGGCSASSATRTSSVRSRAAPPAKPPPQRPTSPVQRLAGAVLIEVAVEPDSELVGRRLREISLPKEAVVTTIHRDDDAVVIPRGDVEIEADDLPHGARRARRRSRRSARPRSHRARGRARPGRRP